MNGYYDIQINYNLNKEKKEKQVVVYAASSGAFAACLSWLLRYIGHDAVAVLDGGWQGWRSTAQVVETGEGKCKPSKARLLVSPGVDCW